MLVSELRSLSAELVEDIISKYEVYDDDDTKVDKEFVDAIRLIYSSKIKHANDYETYIEFENEWYRLYRIDLLKQVASYEATIDEYTIPYFGIYLDRDNKTLGLIDTLTDG